MWFSQIFQILLYSLRNVACEWAPESWPRSWCLLHFHWLFDVLPNFFWRKVTADGFLNFMYYLTNQLTQACPFRIFGSSSCKWFILNFVTQLYDNIQKPVEQIVLLVSDLLPAFFLIAPSEFALFGGKKSGGAGFWVFEVYWTLQIWIVSPFVDASVGLWFFFLKKNVDHDEMESKVLFNRVLKFQCRPVYADESWWKIYNIYLTIIHYFVPMIILDTAYTMIAIKVRGDEKGFDFLSFVCIFRYGLPRSVQARNRKRWIKIILILRYQIERWTLCGYTFFSSLNQLILAYVYADDCGGMFLSLLVPTRDVPVAQWG